MNCTAVGFPLPAIEWRSLRTDQVIVSNVTQTSDYYTTSFLTLRNLLKNDAGNYSCSIPEYSAENIIFSLNILSKLLILTLFEKPILLLIIFLFKAKPDRPIIVEVDTILVDRIKIVWYLDDTGSSSLTHGYIEWSNNFSNLSSIENHTSKQAETELILKAKLKSFFLFKVVFEPQISEASKNLEIYLNNITIEDESFIRLSVRNAIGLSDPSGPFKLVRKMVSMKIKASFVTATLITILSVAALALIFSTIIFTM